MRFPEKDSSTFRGVITGAQTAVGVVILFITGLFGVIGGVPGCGEAIVGFIKENVLQVAAFFGVSSGLVSFAWNALFRKDVQNY